MSRATAAEYAWLLTEVGRRPGARAHRQTPRDVIRTFHRRISAILADALFARTASWFAPVGVYQGCRCRFGAAPVDD